MNDVGLTKLFNSIQKMGYILHADIKEFGYLYFDHVFCFHLSFWSDVAFGWPVRDPRFWTNKEIMKKIILNIVPKDTRGQRYNERENSIFSCIAGIVTYIETSSKEMLFSC